MFLSRLCWLRFASFAWKGRWKYLSCCPINMLLVHCCQCQGDFHNFHNLHNLPNKQLLSKWKVRNCGLMISLHHGRTLTNEMDVWYESLKPACLVNKLLKWPGTWLYSSLFIFPLVNANWLLKSQLFPHVDATAVYFICSPWTPPAPS